MPDTITAPTQQDLDLTTDVAYTVGLAITETSGSMAPILNHGPSTQVVDADTVRTTLFIPHHMDDDELTAAAVTLGRYGARLVEVDRNDTGRWLWTVELNRGPEARRTWMQAAERTITPAPRRARTNPDA